MVEAINCIAAEKMNVFRMALHHALEDVFSTMIGEQIETVENDAVLEMPRISSIIGLAGKVSGFLSLHFDINAACKVAGGLLGMPVEELDETVRDAVAELANMVAGGLKKQISDSGEAFKVSIPSVVEGVEYSTRGPGHSTELWLGVRTASYSFKAQLVLENK